MGWSNGIPNPLVVGGSGQSGVIEVYDAAGRLLLVIDEDGITVYDTTTGDPNGIWDDLGLTVYGPDDSYAFTTPDIDPGYYGGGAGLTLRPAYTGVQTITDPAVILGAEQSGFPILSLNAPTMNNQGLTFIDLFGEDASGANPGHIQIQTGGVGGYVEFFADLRLTGGETLDIDGVQTFTPSWTGSVSNPNLGAGAILGRYQYLNANCVKMTILAAPGAGATKGSGVYSFTVPVPASSSDGIGSVGNFWINDSGAFVRTGQVIFNGSTGTVQLFPAGASGGAFTAAILTGAFTSSSVFIDITYWVN